MTTNISVVCPIYNESEYIIQLLDFLVESYPKNKQVFLIDGGSKDDTLKKISQYPIPKEIDLILLKNPEKIVPYALNYAIPKCNGQIIIRIDAHTKYDIDYFKNIIETFNQTDADIVGGPTRTAFHNEFQESIAYIFNTKLGMGNSTVHDVNYKGYTDSVTFGAWKREIFEQTGLFDTRLKRNQDDEFHYRARSLGFKIYQHPEIKLYYYPRSNIKGLFKQYFEYGYFKPMVLRKIKSEIKLRHLISSIFILYMLTLILSLIIKLNSILLFIPLLLYFVLVFYYSINNNNSLKAKLISFIAYPTIHISYGIGFILGLKNIL